MDNPDLTRYHDRFRKKGGTRRQISKVFIYSRSQKIDSNNLICQKENEEVQNEVPKPGMNNLRIQIRTV